ncbi:hypothetical protein [Haloterrigena turkmenica]|nr:hypothetical protein [Haloterrigena turkmenica]
MERVAIARHVITSTLGTLATLIKLVHLLDGDADIAEREFDPVDELAV